MTSTNRAQQGNVDEHQQNIVMVLKNNNKTHQRNVDEQQQNTKMECSSLVNNNKAQ
jgi:hypothetical protein